MFIDRSPFGCRFQKVEKKPKVFLYFEFKFHTASRLRRLWEISLCFNRFYTIKKVDRANCESLILRINYVALFVPKHSVFRKDAPNNGRDASFTSKYRNT